ncbi:MAG: rubrerythrin family protein [Candidatus Buchananbacteria bacterium RIFCSPHIGHO2_01_FULL_39_14]|uniref:Rubrerythrin family protein n=1 Tax=Candidatus Buchananbacteria bacterium RIFCSPHIGHO2_01_FULL_39_14 TaxID=1797532 RepID=A0A1G1XV87_9BACT|nr:MAG: rubrerythrin family protein [Candidatus Buchananbacteria bacterium RIFCSPHIGHO2_01_FULL_39_14]
MIDTKIKCLITQAQKNEITEHFVYEKLATATKDKKNFEVLHQIAHDELNHYQFWQKYSDKQITPNWFKVWRYFLMAKILGLTFGIRLMEQGEKQAQKLYQRIARDLPEAMAIHEDEDRHEQQLIHLINEEKLRYVSSIVLGINDALVELTGALAGLTLALQNAKIIAVSGLITGIAASFSMAASEYLSTKASEEIKEKNPLRAAIYTGVAYILTVLFLIFPYLVLPNLYLALALTITNAILVILLFTFYISVAKNVNFKKRFAEMAAISLSIAALSFGFGFLIRVLFGLKI